MKSLLKFIILFLFAIQFYGCDKDDVKTPGEVTGEKIMALVNSNAITKCYIWQPDIRGYFTFEVDGQFLITKSINGETHDYIFNLDRLAYFYVDKNCLCLSFKEE